MTEREIFVAALQRDDPAQRQGYLDEACAGQPELRRQVEKLLLLYEGAGSFLERPAAASAATGELSSAAEPASSPEDRGTVIGPYKLIEQIGEGGMGTVWMAQQTEPVKRLVALKLIKAGMDTKQVIARFEAERQALALMDHPHIAKVFDAGMTGERNAGGSPARPDAHAGEPPALRTGRPYFVMELVKGVPITKYCDEHHLTPRQRLELFIPVCQAVQHAHQKGIIHRDLKPSNVLVALYDGKPVPKVIDFGVAKAAGQPLTEQTLVTGFGAIVGTLEYMSPEQAEINQLDIDTRSDIYSLGVLLYELLTGSTPFSRKELEKAGMLEMLRVIREQEPSRPSTKLSSSDALPTLSANRGTEPAKLTRLVRGELDWIVMKALEKDRSRRYETANGFALDVQRYLADEAVQACPPSAGYRLRKFAKKNRAALATAAALAALLVTGITVSTWQAVRATRAETSALEAADAERRAKLDAEEQRASAIRSAAREADERKKADAARTEAQAKEAEANAVVKFFVDKVFAAGRPKGQAGGLGHEVSLRDAVRASLQDLSKSFETQPLVEARLRMALGKTFYDLGELSLALEQTELAHTLYARHFGSDHQVTLRSMSSLAHSYHALGRYAEAAKLREETLAAQRRVLPPDHSETLGTMNDLAFSYNRLGRHDEALKLHEETLAAWRRLLPPDHPSTLTFMNNLANNYYALNRHAEALKLREETLAAQRRVLPPDHPYTLSAMYNLARSYAALGRHAEALKLLEETLAAQRRVLPPDHPSTLKTMSNLANRYDHLGRLAEARKLREETLTAQRRVLPPEHSDTLMTMANLANSYSRLGRHAEALKLREEALAAQRRVLPPDDLDMLGTMGNQARTYIELGRHAEALALVEEILAKGDGPGVTAIRSNAIRIQFRCFQKIGDPAKCRSAAELFEKLKLTAAQDLFDAASYRAVTASLQSKAKEPDAAQLAREDADKAMSWLKQAVAAGYADFVHLGRDADLDLLREREDFRALMVNLLAKVPPLERGRYHILLSQWDEAAAAFAKVDWSRPPDDDDFAYACLFLLRGDGEGYDHFCQGLIKRAGRTEDHFEAFVLARTCGVARSGPVDPARAVEWGKQAVAGAQPAWYFHALGLAQYRAGRFEEALQSFARADKEWGYRDLNWFGRALVHFSKGDPDEAQRCLDRGVQWLDREGPPGPGRPANIYPIDWLEAHLLRREAEELIGPKAKETSDKK